VLIINRGRLLYDGELSALVETLAPVRRLEVVVGAGVAERDLARFGEVTAYDPPRATLEVPRRAVAEVSARLLAALPVADLSITDPPIEEVIRRAFAGEGVRRAG
jgi:ABC-2 type transport system ATP-binding protein